MPKSIPVKPEALRAPGVLSFPDVPLHAYQRNLAEERQALGDAVPPIERSGLQSG